MTDTYVCDNCGGEFSTVWSDEEALREFDQNFPSHSRGEELVRVCDDCYKVLMAQFQAMNQ